MSKRVVPDRRTATGASPRAHEALETAPLSADLPDVEIAGEVILPREHPRWLRDRFTVSAATKALIDRIKPAALRIFGFWDHRIHRLALENATIGVDACGSYRCE